MGGQKEVRPKVKTAQVQLEGSPEA